MSTRTLLWLLIWTAGLIACGEDATAPMPLPAPPPPPAFVSAGLKDITIASLPSPYYHFEYDSGGQLAFASFASDFFRYNVIYTDGRIKEMDNDILVNHDRLIFVYDHKGRVKRVREVDEAGELFEELVLAYDGPRLAGLERHRTINGAFVIDKETTFSYFPDGNLHELAQHRFAIDGFQDEQRYADVFEEYDTGINVDGFGLLHDDFFDHLALLPVELQKGNPHRVTRTGDGLNFTTENTYAYDGESRPLTKTGVVTITTGPNAGQQFQTSCVYSYY